MSDITTIIVAGGSGTRMGSSLPKQFLPIGGIPILMRTIDRFYHSIGEHQIIVTLPRVSIPLWEELIKEHNFTTTHTIAAGGSSRFESVKNGLALISDSSNIILVHDGVRPFTSKQIIDDIIGDSRAYKAAIPYTEQTDSIRELLDGGHSQIADRSRYVSIQTPQGFDKEVLITSYRQPYNSLFTDDASVVESNGYRVHLTRGEHTNIKITKPEDILMANAILKV